MTRVWMRPALQRFVQAGVEATDDERRRLRKTGLTLLAGIVILLAPAWVLTYFLLDRPLAAALPAAYIALSVIGLGWLFLTKRDGFFIVSQTVAIFVLPFALQWVLGGFVKGSAVALWAFTAPMVALVGWGARAAVVVFTAFIVAIVVSGLAEARLAQAVPALPPPVQIGFFVLNLAAPLAATFALLLYFNRERDAAAAASESLLLSILPVPIAHQLKAGRRQIAERHEEATVAFIDFVGFTSFAERTPPERVVELLDRAFSALDQLAERFGVEKIKTLGDGYLAAAGVTEPSDDHAVAVAEMALAAPDELRRCLGDDWPGVEARIGLASGPVIAGVIGERRFGFDLWGDTVNTASRMATHAAPGEIQVTEATCALLGEAYRLERRVAVEVKGKSSMTTYVLLGRRD
ncbi:MAG: adenylate/guanylate cyclase domain-containing protein [Candidatus Limnocylindria bacterium]